LISFVFYSPADFGRRYKAKYSKEPSYHAACAYEAIRIMSETASKNNTSAKLRAGLKAGSWNGILGPVKFADYGGFTNQNNHPMLVQQIQGGKYETVYPAQFSKKALVYPFKR